MSWGKEKADLRLTESGHGLGLVDAARWRRFNEKRASLAHEQERLQKTWLHPGSVPETEAMRVFAQPFTTSATLLELLRRPEVSYAALMSLPGAGDAVMDTEIAQQLEIHTKYAGYIERQSEEIALHLRHEEMALPTNLDYHSVRGLSVEACQKLTAQRPTTLGQAARLSGITPAAISLLLVHLRRKRA